MSDAGLDQIYVGHCTKHVNTYVLVYGEETFSALTKMSEYVEIKMKILPRMNLGHILLST